MANIPRKLRRRQSGQALVEFALVLLFIILPVTLVLMDGAMMLFTYASMTNSAREAARAGSIYQDDTTLSIDYADTTANFTYWLGVIDGKRLNFIKYDDEGRRAVASPLIPFASNASQIDQCATTVTYDPPSPSTENIRRAFDSMTVTLACPHPLLFGLGPFGVITLTAQSTMRIEPGSSAPITP